MVLFSLLARPQSRHAPSVSSLLLRFAHAKSSRSTRRPKAPPPPPPPPTPPKPPEKLVPFSIHGETWHDPYSWMSDLADKAAMRHMDVCMEQEEKYTEAVMTDTERLQRKLLSEMAPRMTSHLSTPPVRWGPWLYYRRVEEGKQFPVLCRRSATLNEEFISYNEPSAGFDFTSGRRIEVKLLDYNEEAEKFGGYAYEELSEVSPDHRFLAYTMYDKDNDYFTMSVRDLALGSLCDKPRADRVANLAWAADGKTLLYTVTNGNKRPYRIFCSIIGSDKEDLLILEEFDENVYVNIRNTKDFRFVTVHTFSNTFSRVYLINGENPTSGMTLVWECEPQAHCTIEHHRGYLFLFTDAARMGLGAPVDSHYLLRCSVEAAGSKTWEDVFIDDPNISIEDADFCDTHLALILREGRKYQICSIALPLPVDVKLPMDLNILGPHFLPLPEHVCQILAGTNYDYYSSTMRFIISSPVMPDAVVDYDLSNGKWMIVQQQDILHERTRTLYGTAASATNPLKKSSKSGSLYSLAEAEEVENSWNDLSEFYVCDYYEVPSDGVMVPLTIVYSSKHKLESPKPGLLHGHGAYGELLDKRWRSEFKSLLDRGWIIAYADVRGGGGKGKLWHHEGRQTNKGNSIIDYISCAKFLIEKGFVQENKLAGWGYSAGGHLVAAAINACTELFRAAVLKVPFLDPTHTFLYPVLPLQPTDYDEFGFPGDAEGFQAIRKYSPYDNIQKDALYPAVLVTSSFNTRFGVWEAAKWVARVRQLAVYDPQRPILLNLTTDIVEENKYLQCKESALELAFLIKMMDL
ncbi:uncharacterized protein [Aristolochia californica]|uniref:uncharacterized protein n=1 Tax=Aristolochia californica TaxID=171875 RepID=UPI0035D81C1D